MRGNGNPEFQALGRVRRCRWGRWLYRVLRGRVRRMTVPEMDMMMGDNEKLVLVHSRQMLKG